MKKAFTLVEMVIVLLIIWILFWILAFFSWSYVWNLNIQNDKETLEWDFFYTQATSMSQPKVGNVWNLSYIWIKLSPGEKYFSIEWLTGDLNSSPFSIKTKSLNYTKLWTGAILSGNVWKITLDKDVYIFYKPYTIWSYVVTDGNIYSWSNSLFFKLETTKYGKKFLCFRVDFPSWRLFENACNF